MEDVIDFPKSYRFGTENEFQIRVAASCSDRLKAWNLVYRVYQEQGFASTDPQELWYGAYDAMPSTTTFLVEQKGKPVAALTVVFDREIGIPAGELYPDEINALRAENRRLSEVISLVNTEKRRLPGANIVRHLFKLAYITARRIEGATDFVATVNPHHKDYYKQALLFKQIGKEKSYGRVGEAPAVLLRLDLVTLEDEYRLHFEGLKANRNFYRFIMDRIDVVIKWIRLERKELDEESLKKYFIKERPLIQPPLE